MSEEHSKAKMVIISVLMALTILSNFCGILALLRRKSNGGKLTRMYSIHLIHVFSSDLKNYVSTGILKQI